MIFALLLSGAACADAAAERQTKADWLANKKVNIEARGKTYDAAHMSAAFDSMDLDKDGILTPEEMAAHKAARKSGKKPLKAPEPGIKELKLKAGESRMVSAADFKIKERIAKNKRTQSTSNSATTGPDIQANELEGSRPNIILVLTDDQGMGDLSCMGNPILKTPHIDALYRKSTRFADFQVSPTCSPTRAAIMSGRLPFEVGVSHTIMQRDRLAPAVVTFPQALQQAGYSTGLFGKWHLGDGEAYLPQNRGFDEVLMHGAGGIGQYSFGDFKENATNKYFDNVLLHNDTIVKTKGFCTDLFFKASLAWIKKQQDAKQPFFAYISLNAPHGPLIAPEKYKKRFLDEGYNQSTAARYGMIENIDDNMGLLMAKLREWNALENTLVIFMTDNGMAMKSIGKKGQTGRLMAWNAGLKGHKDTNWEGGTHVPAFWYWQGVLGEGVDVPALTAHIDLYRTFCSLAGAKIPESTLPPRGRSLLPLLEDPNAEWLDRTLYSHRGRWGGGGRGKKTRALAKYYGASVRTQRWRLVYEMDSEGPWLSDISADPGETKNLVNEYPDVAEQLKAGFDQWWDASEAFLVNKDLPRIKAGEYHLHKLYNQQLKEMGIPHWEPEQF